MDQAQQLRNIVKRQNQVNPGKARVITVTSGKGGVGKSNTTVNLAVELRKLGKSVIIFDADFGLANVEVMFGALPKYNLSDIIFKGKSIREIITEGPEGIQFISGGSGIVELSNLNRQQIGFMIKNLADLDDMTDVIIIDTGAGISDSVMEFVLASPEVLLVTTPEPSSLTDAYFLLKALYRNPLFDPTRTMIHVLANKVSSLEDGDVVFNKLSSVVTQFLGGELDYIGIVPADSSVDKAIRQQKPVTMLYPNAKSSEAYRVLADNLINGKHEQMEMKRGIAQLFANFVNKMK
ncbi:MAG: MinD/ParA family protein [Lachnospiraceae bacterium]|jgi:flagellar biosynthesis protein FlhG|nr:MinD/ParA family protein [Lachnospiraceae bacterium]